MNIHKYELLSISIHLYVVRKYYSGWGVCRKIHTTSINTGCFSTAIVLVWRTHVTWLCLYWNNVMLSTSFTEFDKICQRLSGLTLPMLKLLSSKAKRRKAFWKPSKPCHVGIRWIALAEYYQMSTDVTGFQSFSSFLIFITV